MKFRLFLALCAVWLAADVHAQTTSPAAPPPPGTLPPVEMLAEDAQRELFEAADGAGRSNSAQSDSTPGRPAGVTSTGRRTTFSTVPGTDAASWPKDSIHKVAVMEIGFGGVKETVMFELFPAEAPRTVTNFINNCESGSYNGLAFHRAIQGFLVQTGDPLTADESARERWGTGGETKTVPAEIKRLHRKGSVGMGRRSDASNPSRKSNGYQFYFALGNFAALDGAYTVFGQVVSGLDVLERISKMPVDSNDCPVARIEVESVRVIDHKGPLYPTPEDSSNGRRVTKPAASKGFFERMLERVW